MALGLTSSLGPHWLRNGLRDLGGDEEVDFDTTVVVDIAGMLVLAERKAADH